MGIPLDKAKILAIFLETLLYGIFFTLFWLTLLVLILRGDGGQTQRRQLVPLGTVMMVIATAHLIIDFVRVVEAFVAKGNSPIDANAYYEMISHPLHVVKTALYVTQTIIGDAVVIWRCYILLNQSLLVLIPNVIVLLVNAAAGYVVCWSLSQASPGSEIFQTASAWITTFFVLTMCINVTCTVAISWRIYSARSPLSTQTSLTLVLLVVVESGALYASSVLALMVAYVSGSNGQYPALDVVTPLVGITFCLIILQIQLRFTSNAWSMSTTRNDMSTIIHSNKRRKHREDQTLAYPMQPLAVHVTVDQGGEQKGSSSEHKLGGFDGQLELASSETKVDVPGPL
ncbi:hypothetical protein AB1N83_006450 [Pleurotus pulmonarius]